MQHATLDIALVPALAVLAALVTRSLGRRVPIPLPAVEILLGVVAGPAVLGLVEPDELVSTLAELGGAVLFLIAGTEVDARALIGRVGARALAAWAGSFLVLLAAGSALAGPAIGVVLAVALSSTAVGMLLPILKDAGDLTSPFGTAVVANGAVGEFLPLIAMSLLLSGRPLGSAAAVLAMFTLAATVVLWLAVWMRHDRLHAFIRQTQHTSSQFGLRVVFLVLGGLVAMDLLLGLDILLGAFVTGLVLRALLADAPRDDIELVESKLQGLGFGFIVPVFFIHAGLTFDLRAMMAQPALFGVALAAAATLFVVRGLLGMLSAPAGSSPHARLALGAYTATALPIIVAATAAATAAGVIDGGLTAALVGGGLVSVLVGPVVGAALRRRDLAAAHPDRSDVGAFVSDLG